MCISRCLVEVVRYRCAIMAANLTQAKYYMGDAKK